MPPSRPPPTATVVLTVCVVLALLAQASAAASVNETRPDGPAVTVDGAGAFTHDNETYLWRSEPFTVELLLAAPRNESRVCLRARRRGRGPTETIGCTDASSRTGTAVTRIALDEWPATPGRYEVVVHARGRNLTVARGVSTLVVVAKAGDVDHDRLANARERAGPTDFTHADTDVDGLTDGTEVLDYRTAPTDVDTDGDGLRDGVELVLGTRPRSPTHNVSGLPSELMMGGPAGASSASTADDPAETATFIEFGRTHWYLSAVALLLVGVGVVADRYVMDSRGPSGATTDVPHLRASEAALLDELRARGGIEHQSSIADRLGWSKGKVSRVLSKLEARGLIEKVRDGRQNVIVLVDDAP